MIQKKKSMESYIQKENTYDHIDWIKTNVYSNSTLFKKETINEPENIAGKKREKVSGIYDPCYQNKKVKNEKKINYFALKEHPYKLFLKVEQSWIYFKYTITAINQNYKIASRLVYKAEDIELERLPLTISLLKTILEDINCPENNIQDFIQNGPWMKYASKIPSILNAEEVLKHIRNYPEIPTLSGMLNLNIQLCKCNGLKYYFL
jgi:hypothetical protein